LLLYVLDGKTKEQESLELRIVDIQFLRSSVEYFVRNEMILSPSRGASPCRLYFGVTL